MFSRFYVFHNVSQVQERDLSVDELLEAEEVFCTGTAVVIKAVETVTFHDKR